MFCQNKIKQYLEPHSDNTESTALNSFFFFRRETFITEANNYIYYIFSMLLEKVYFLNLISFTVSVFK